MLTSIGPAIEDSPDLLFSTDLRASWFLLRTRSRQEKIVANDLAARNVLHFLPLMRCVRYYGNRKTSVEMPLFPGYVFLRGLADDAFAIDRAGRLAQIIRITDQFRVNDELKNIALALRNDAQLSQYPYLHAGVHVEVRSGPFRGLRGVIEDWSKRNRLILQVEILGRGVSLEVDAALLDVTS
jgi:transcription termination/antitermination protein NusG